MKSVHNSVHLIFIDSYNIDYQADLYQVRILAGQQIIHFQGHPKKAPWFFPKTPFVLFFNG